MSALKYTTIILDIHCKDTIPKIRNKYSPERELFGHSPNFHIRVSVSDLSHDGSAYSAAGKYVDRSCEYIRCSQTHECGNWDRGRAIPR
jgi:hypothetical protein